MHSKYHRGQPERFQGEISRSRCPRIQLSNFDRNLFLAFVILSFAVFNLHLDSTNQLIGSAITQFQQNLTQRLLLFASCRVSTLNVQSLIQLINSDVAKLDENLPKESCCCLPVELSPMASGSSTTWSSLVVVPINLLYHRILERYLLMLKADRWTHPKVTTYGCWVSPLTRFIGSIAASNDL